MKRLIDLNKTQVWLCNEVGISKVYLNYIIHGERQGKKRLPKIFKVLGLDYEKHRSA